MNDFTPILSEFQTELRYCSDGVFVSVVGESFYNQCVPAESLDIGVSFTSTHWLNVSEGDVDESVYDEVRSTVHDNSCAYKSRML